MSDDHIALEAVLLDTAPIPFTYLNFHKFLSNLELEIYSNFLVECLLYKQKANLFFVSADLTTFPAKPAEMALEEYGVEIKDLISRWTRLTETYILNGSPSQIRLDKEVRNAILEHIDMNYFHPDILKAAVEEVTAALKPHFDAFLVDPSLHDLSIGVTERKLERRNATPKKTSRIDLILSIETIADVGENEDTLEVFPSSATSTRLIDNLASRKQSFFKSVVGKLRSFSLTTKRDAFIDNDEPDTSHETVLDDGGLQDRLARNISTATKKTRSISNPKGRNLSVKTRASLEKGSAKQKPKSPQFPKARGRKLVDSSVIESNS